MKTLLLMRHAKSSWKHPELRDFDRPLNKRGREDAPRMGRLLQEQELVPQLIISSSAVRARQTVDGLLEASGYSGEVRYFDSLYEAESSIYLDLIQALPDHLDSVMVVGHNPTMEEVLEMLTGQAETMSTASIAQLALPIREWKALNGDVEGELRQVWRPRDL